MGVGENATDSKKIQGAVADMTVISGQKPVVTKAKKSVATFKLRDGMAIGCKVTLRGIRMYEFLDRLINVVLPRIRDFRGLSPKGFDRKGNYTLGIREEIIFPELDIDKIKNMKGLSITIITSTNIDAQSCELLTLFGIPFRKTKA